MRILFDPLFDLARQFRLLPIFVNTPYEPRLKKDGIALANGDLLRVAEEAGFDVLLTAGDPENCRGGQRCGAGKLYGDRSGNPVIAEARPVWLTNRGAYTTIEVMRRANAPNSVY